MQEYLSLPCVSPSLGMSFCAGLPAVSCCDVNADGELRYGEQTARRRCSVRITVLFHFTVLVFLRAEVDAGERKLRIEKGWNLQDRQ